MPLAKTKSGFTTIATTGAIQQLDADKKLALSVVYIYPAGTKDTQGILNSSDGTAIDLPNQGNINVGIYNGGPSILPDVLQPDSLPLKISIPPGRNGDQEQILVKDIIIRGTATDRVYWFGFE